MFKLLYYIGVVIVFLVLASFKNDFSLDLLSTILFVNSVSILAFLLRKEHLFRLKRQYFKHSYFFLLGFVIVYFQLPLDVLYAGETPFDSELFVSTNLIIPNAIYSTIGLHFFFVGYELYSLRSYYSKQSTELRIEKKFKLGNCKYLNFFVLITFVGYIMTINPLYLSGQYGSVEMGTTAGYFIVAFKLFFTASILQQSFNLKSKEIIIDSFWSFIKNIDKLPIIVLGFYLFSVLISGDRDPLMYYSLLIVVTFFYVSKKKIKLAYLLGLGFSAAIVITILGIIRSPDLEGSFFEKIEYALEAKKEGTSISENTRELARSYRILSLGIQNIPYKYDYQYGEYQLKMLLSTVPGLYNSIEMLVDDPEFSEFLTTSEVYTWLYFGDFPRYGLGTSSLGDLYVDFGLFGICIGMVVFGFCMRYAEEILYVNDSVSMFALVFSVVYLCSVMFISRNMLLFDLATVVKVYLLILLNRTLVKVY